MRPVRRTAVATLASILSLLAAGCEGGGEPGELNGLTRLAASHAARDAMDEQSIDPESPAHGRTWLIDKTEAEQLDDGSWAWRVRFFSIEDESQTLCMWLQLTERTLTTEDIEYFVDPCPSDAAS